MAEVKALPSGTIVWKMGQMWGILPPDINGEYLDENIRYSTYAPDGITDTYFGKGSFRRSIQIVGTPSTNIDTTINLGWVHIRLSMLNGQVQTEIKGGSEAASKRWAMGILAHRHNRHYNRSQFPNTILIEDVNTNEFTTTKRVRQVRDSALWDWLRSEAYIRDKGICWVCNEFVPLRDYDLGHLVDRSNGGNDSLMNCAVMHKHCNSIKPSHHTLEAALIWRLTYNNP